MNELEQKALAGVLNGLCAALDEAERLYKLREPEIIAEMLKRMGID